MRSTGSGSARSCSTRWWAGDRSAADAAPLLRRDVAQGLRERPLVPGRILRGVLALAVLEVGRLHEDRGAAGPRVLAMGAGVLDAHHHRVGDLAGARGAAVL